MKKFLQNESGTLASMFALTLVPVLGVLGVAVDYSNASNQATRLQTAVDSAALSAVVTENQTDVDSIKKQLKATLSSNGQASGFEGDITVNGSWVTPTDFKLRAEATIKNRLTPTLPGTSASTTVSAEALARFYRPVIVNQPPTATTLDAEAGDYNQIIAYCYDVKLKDDPQTKGRSQKTVIVDNAGTQFNNPFPKCASYEIMSHALRNVRNARTNPKLWYDKKAEQYEYYMDTTYDGYQMQVNLGGIEILETVICDNLSICKPRSQGGVLPEGKNRSPQLTQQSCDPGKYIYYGWEDRPPGLGWTDRDYDDIRMIVECPKIIRGDKEVRLVK